MPSATKLPEASEFGQIVPRDPVPPELWGRDHFTVLMYIETCIVNSGGIPDRNRVRTDPSRHPMLEGSHFTELAVERKKYPTHLRNNVMLDDHDDWDCCRDMEAAGLLVWAGNGSEPRFSLSDRGWLVAGELRRHRAEGKRLADLTMWDVTRRMERDR